MGGWGQGFVLRVLAAIVCVVAAVWLALWYFIPAPPTTIRIGVGFSGGNLDRLAKAYRERLARHQVKLEIVNHESTLSGLKLLHDKKSGIDIGFSFAGATNAGEIPEVVSLGRVGFSPLWILYRGDETIDRLNQLRGKRIGVNLFSHLVQFLDASGVNNANSTLVNSVGVAAVNGLQNGELDVVMTIGELSSPPVQRIRQDPTIRVMNLSQAAALTRIFPYLTHLLLPQGTLDLDKNVPPIDINLIATTLSVLVRQDLHPQLVYLLAQTLRQEHGGAGAFHRAGEFPTQDDPDFPVAEEAIDYYKNGPSFLQRYLPFWMISYAKRAAAVVVAAVAVVIPVLTYGPRLYDWLLRSRVIRLYRRLRAVNARLKDSPSADALAALQADLEEINRAANILPMRHSDLFFSLLMHIDMTRTRLAARLRELRPEQQVA